MENDMDNQTPTPMTIGLRVTDVQRALEFYQSIGFKPVMTAPNERGEPVFCAMSYGSSFLVFDGVETDLPMPDTQRERATRQGPRGLGVKIGIETPDIEPIYQHFRATGCEITCEPMEEFWCERLFTALDPFGYEWQFTQGSKTMSVEEQAEAARLQWNL